MIVVGDGMLDAGKFGSVVFDDAPVSLSASALERVQVNHDFLKQFSFNKLIYGINTGFGPMAQYKVSESNLLHLQYNLIRSHCSGSGRLIDARQVRALMLARLSSLMQGYSGIHAELVALLVALINAGITPCIYEHGGVGASGDLVQLAHLGLCLIGEGEVMHKGEIKDCAEAMRSAGIAPLKIHVREGLAILNGTSAMTGIGMINVLRARRLLDWAVTLSAMTNEVVEAYDDHYSNELNKVKPHAGQQEVAAMLRELLGDSQMIRSRAEHLYNPDNINREVFEGKVQEYYSLRCITQVLGPVLDTINYSESVLVNELNSVNDNPVIDHEAGNVFHGGNFHGDYVSLEMDKLKTVITKLSMLSERQLNYLLNDKLNRKLPPFVNLGVLGFNFGMQGVQFTATSTVAENQSLSFPVYVHSISNNNDNQDIVSMGSNAALMTARVIDNSFEVLSIQLMTLVQAIDYLECVPRLASRTLAVYNDTRKVFPKFVEDIPHYKEQRQVKDMMEAGFIIRTLSS